MVLTSTGAGAVALKLRQFRRKQLISSVTQWVVRLRIIIVMSIRYAL
jgi:hypothetical protein